jgi:hypothetical protein
MKESLILQNLEELAASINLKVNYENLRKEDPGLKGGLCKVKGEYQVFCEKNLTLSEKIEVLLDALKDFDWEGAYVNPYIRKLLEKRKGKP